MKKEWIMTDEEKKKKKQKIEENRARKMGEVGHEDDDCDDGGGNSQHSNNNSNDDNNNDNDGSNDVPVSLPPTSSAMASLTKPQAVVVGVIREGDSLPSKVSRTEAEANTDHRPQLHPVIREYQTEYSSSSPLDSPTKKREGKCNLLAPGLSSPATVERSEGASNPCLAEVFAISIKKEVEYMDDEAAATAATALHNHHHHHHHCDPHNQLTLSHHHHNYPSYHNPLPPHPTSSPHPEPLPLRTSPHDTSSMSHQTPPPIQPTPSSIQYIPTEIHSTSPLPQPHHSISLHHHNPNETQTDSGDECGGFSIREAMEILHPEDKNSKESSSVMDTLMNTAIRAEYSSPLLSLHMSPPSELNEAERAKLEELTEANKGLLAPLCEDYNFKDLSNPSLINVINLTEIAIRRLIKMAKRISSFKTLCQEDQIALLKGGCTEMMILRSVCAYDPDKDSWKIQQDHSKTQDIKLKVLKAAPGNVYEEHKRFILAFDPEWRKDPHIIFLLCAITLFSPRRPHIIHADAILHEQCSYLYLTRRYLAARYNPCAGRAVYHQLLHRLAHLHRLSEEHVRLFLEVNPKQVEPLLIEIFDLKQ
ncbi:nuclear hormone receptor HR96-like [Portunus trituberculatus]|uniref:nuclear hormone receptor HR96-like n=1 Tax=Portunus trituberculatus TaxID=210409 RepID=UPI001E1CD67E|nr:nuclear hormone receptor HR96-like [Portunus trituberculatus]